MRIVEAELQNAGSRMPNAWSQVKLPEDFWGDLSLHGRRLLKELLQGTMETWRDEWVEVDWHQPTQDRRSYRNGYYRRKHWPTALGRLQNVRVPRCRERGLTRHMFARLPDHRQALGDSVLDMLLAGVSTRRVGEHLEQILDLPVSAGQVSRLAQRLDQEVRAFHTRALQDQYVYLLLDGIHLKARGVPRLLSTGLRRTRKRVLLVAYGMREDGIRQVIGFYLAKGESFAAWKTFLWSLYRRGLEGKNLKLITTDGAQGLVSALQEVWAFVAHQRCWFHKMQNVAGRVRKKDQAKVLEGLRKVYTAPMRRAAEAQYIAWARRWQELYPSAVGCVQKDLAELLAVFALPAEHRKMVHTTNPIERCFREVRRRTRSIGTFVNDASMQRIVYGVVAYMNRKYARGVWRVLRIERFVA
jgi:transposase-like protein